MAISDSFAKLKNLFTAIQDLDNALAVQDADILDTILGAVKDIPKSEYPEEEKQKIIDAIRHSLVVLYAAETRNISSHIGITFDQYSIGDIIPESEDDQYDEEYQEEQKVPVLKIPKDMRPELEESERPRRKSKAVDPEDDVDNEDLDFRDERDTRGGYLSNNISSKVASADVEDYDDDYDDYYEHSVPSSDDGRLSKKKSSSKFMADIMSAGRRKVSDSERPSKIVRDSKA